MDKQTVIEATIRRTRSKQRVIYDTIQSGIYCVTRDLWIYTMSFRNVEFLALGN